MSPRHNLSPIPFSAKLAELWIIPIFFIVVTIISMIVAFFLGWMFKLKRSQRCAIEIWMLLRPIIV
jgi:predicted permease